MMKHNALYIHPIIEVTQLFIALFAMQNPVNTIHNRSIDFRTKLVQQAPSGPVEGALSD